jgi:hypothetical protein
MNRSLLAFLALTAIAAPALADEAAPASSLARMPIKEVTVFKDGHAFVLHQGMMPTDAAGNVVMDYLPTPVIGTFWPYCPDKKATLHSVTAGRRRIRVERTAMNLRDLVEANPGAEVIVSEGKDAHYPATIVRFLSRSVEELDATSPVSAGEHLPLKSNLLLLKTADGTRAVPVERISDVKFIGKYQTQLADEEYRNVLTMKLDWGGKAPEKTVEVGMGYVQKGARWIPHYRIELDGKGKAVVKLQATLLNELTDLQNATVHLVIGVPTFYFKETTDPIALSQALAQLSPYFQNDASTQFALSNSMMTQSARMTEVRNQAGQGGGGTRADLGPDIGGGEKSEDLFLFTVKNVTLKKGQRMVLPVSQFKLDYKDVFVLNVPYGPPPELRRTTNDANVAEMLKLLHSPKVIHNVRLTNSSDQPLTTAPAMVVKDDKVLAQGLMTYTARGAAVDLAVTTAVDVKVKKTDKETKRTPNAATFNGETFFRADISGSIALTNYRNQPVEIEVVRYVLGNVGEANEDGKVDTINQLEDDDYLPHSTRPVWWGYYSWPYWWSHFNGIGRVTWNRKLEPGKSADLSYTWHYYWR